MIDLSKGAIGIGLFQKPATLLTPVGRYVDGKWSETPITLPIMAVIQAATQQDLLQYAQGDKLDGYVRIYTFSELRTVDDDIGADAQIVLTPEGKRYRIVKAGRRSEADFTRAIGRLEHDRGRSV